MATKGQTNYLLDTFRDVKKFMEELQFIESLQSPEIKDGDILVIKTKGILKAIEQRNITEFVKKKLPEKMKNIAVFVADSTFDIGVLKWERTVPTKEFMEDKENLEKEISEKLQEFSVKNGLHVVSTIIDHIMPDDTLTVKLNIVFGRE